MRFAKYKGPEIGNIEAHNERTKEKYASNPDVDTSRSKYNFHLVKPPGKYRAESERQIAAAGCRTRKDSIRMIETLFTASPEFFKGKKRAEIRVFFEEALHFLEQHQSKETIISAVVHMDEKTPHMHLCFVPLTEDGRLSAKDIMGNKNNKKERINVVYSTNPNYQYEYNQEEEQETLAPEKQNLRVTLDSKQRKGKIVTLVQGFVGTEENLKELAKLLKNKCGVGGSVKDGEIIIQGEVKEKVLTILRDNKYRAK